VLSVPGDDPFNQSFDLDFGDDSRMQVLLILCEKRVDDLVHAHLFLDVTLQTDLVDLLDVWLSHAGELEA